MDKQLEKKLIDGLDDLENGRSVEEILSQYPKDVSELRQILETAESLSQTRVAHSLEAKANSLQQMLDQAESMREPKASAPFAGFGLRRLVFSFASLVMILVVLSTGLLFASNDALPGDIFYGSKRAVEDIRKSLVNNPASRQKLEEQFNQERIREIQAMLLGKRQGEVEFRGIIERIEGDRWLISSLNVEVDSLIEVTGNVQVGSTVIVIGRIEDGRLLAVQISLQGETINVPTPNPSELISPTPSPAQTKVPAVIPDPTSPSTPRPSPTPPPDVSFDETDMPTEEPPTVQTPLPIGTPDQDDDLDNENEGNQDSGGPNDEEDGNDNEGDNSGDEDNSDENENGDGDSDDGGSNGNEGSSNDSDGDGDDEDGNENSDEDEDANEDGNDSGSEENSNEDEEEEDNAD